MHPSSCSTWLHVFVGAGAALGEVCEPEPSTGDGGTDVLGDEPPDGEVVLVGDVERLGDGFVGVLRRAVVVEDFVVGHDVLVLVLLGLALRCPLGEALAPDFDADADRLGDGVGHAVLLAAAGGAAGLAGGM